MKIARLSAAAFTIPTDKPEADGTLAWDETTMVLVTVTAESGTTGIGFTYSTPAAAQLIQGVLPETVEGLDAEDTGLAWQRMLARVRNIGRGGVAACAISAADVALWDLKAQIQEVPLFRLLNPYRESVMAYGSGGFTSYSLEELTDQLSGWCDAGIRMVKMKVGLDWGTRPDEDVTRVKAAREAIGRDTSLFVDANGAYTRKEAIRQAYWFAEHNVSYFEEPVSSDQLADMASVRAASPMDIAAGEYGYDHFYFRRMLESGAVDILQADVTRCLGITGFLAAGNLAHAFATPFSVHTSPSIHTHAACGVPQISHVEFFHDHARIERMLFEGFKEPRDGCLFPDPSAPGLGLAFKESDARKWQKWP